MISAKRGSASTGKPAPGRRPSQAAAPTDKALTSTRPPPASFPQDHGGSGLDAIADYISSSMSSDQILVPALQFLGEWSFSSNPTAFLHKVQRALFSHPIVSHVPSLGLAMAQCYLQLGDLTSCLRHLLEAHRQIVKSNHGHQSPFVKAKVSELAYALGVTARIEQKDPVKCLTYLNIVSETKYRIAVTLQTAHCLLMMNEVEAALPLFLDLAERTGDPDLVLVCARIYATLHQLPDMCAVLNHLRSLSPSHPGIPDLDAMLHEQVDQYQVEATKLSYLRQYNDVLEVLRLGLELVPTHAELLMLKAETLFALGNPDHLLEFLASWPPAVPTTAKYTSFKVAALEKLLHHHWSSARYQTALTILARLRAARPDALARDRLWDCQLRFLAYGFNASSAFTSAATNQTPDAGMRLLEQDLVQYLDDCARTTDGGGAVDELGTAEALLCQVYARRARNLLAKGSTQGQGPEQWRAGLKLLDKAIDASFPRIHGLGETDLPPFPHLLSKFPKPVPFDKYPLWAQALPATCQAATLWLEKSRVLEKLAETERAVAAARAALVLVPGNLEAKQWLLQLTGDQDELAQLAAVQVNQMWANRDGGHDGSEGGDMASASLSGGAGGETVNTPEVAKRPSPPQSAAAVAAVTMTAAAIVTASSNAPSSSLSAAANAPSRRPMPHRQFQQPNAASAVSPSTPPSAKQPPPPNRQKPTPGVVPNPAHTSSTATTSDQPRRMHPSARDSPALPSVLVGTRVSVTTAANDSAAPAPRPAQKRHAPKHRSTLAPSVAVIAADMPVDDASSTGARRALGPPAALAQSISKHYQALLGQYGGMADGAPVHDVSGIFGMGAGRARAGGAAASSHEAMLDIEALANDGHKAAAYVTRAVEEKVKRDMVQAHQIAEALVQQRQAQMQEPPPGLSGGGGKRETSGGKR